MIHALILIASLVALTLGAEALVRGSVRLAERMGVSSFFIGLTIVGFGTSSPELFTSIAAALRGAGDIAVGNVVGSSIFNIAVILGAAALVYPIRVQLQVVKTEVWVTIAVAVLPWLAILNGGVIGRPLGALFFVGLIGFLIRGYRIGRAAHEETLKPGELPPLPSGEPPERPAKPNVWVNAALAGGGIALLAVSAHYFVESASAIARSLGVSDLVIGLTIVAAGTSAPELVTSVMAALRKQPDVAVGNVLGSNVFNLAGILGLTCVIKPQEVSRQVLVLDTPVLLLASLALLPIMATGARISRPEGAALLIGYTLYALVLFLLAPGWFGAP